MTTKHKLAQLHGRKAARQDKAAGKLPPKAKRAERAAAATREIVALTASQARMLWLGAGLLAAVIAWAYWSTLADIVSAWDRIPDYSHGYLVVPLATYFAWHHRKSAPAWMASFYWPGLVLVALSIGLRVVGALFYIDALDGWSLPLLLAGVVWLVCGGAMLNFCLPSILFLYFAIPLPFRAETMLSVPLQKISTRLSTWVLQSLGQPVIAEGNVILLNESSFEVAQACSGLWILVAVSALAFAYLVLVPRPWWQRLILIAFIVPIALVANSTRVVLTVLLHQYGNEAISHQFSHDFAGWVMIPYAAMLFGALLIYLSWLFPEAKPVAAVTILGRTGRSQT
jgi:exosortase